MGRSGRNKSETAKVILAIVLVGGLIMGMGLLAFVTGIRDLIQCMKGRILMEVKTEGKRCPVHFLTQTA